MKMERTIYYVGEFKFPEGSPSALRVYANAKALQLAGYRVVIISSQATVNNEVVDDDGYKFSEYNGLEYFIVRPKRPGKIRRLTHFVLAGRRLTSILQRFMNFQIAAVICLAGGQLRIFPFLRSLCRSRGVPLICDVMEWYDPRTLPMGRWGVFRWEYELCMRYVFPRLKNIIAISSFLQSYYAAKGCLSLCVPPLIDASDHKWKTERARPPGARVCLSFVGTAAKKDLLVNAIRGLSMLGERSQACHIVIVGPSREEVRSNLGADAELLEELKDNLSFVGRLTHREALRHLSQSDFSILLRPDARFAHAGFPTKLVESLAMGVPVVCNLTSDIGLYVNDGREGIVVNDCSPQAFAEGIRRALSLSVHERATMRECARKRAVLSFDYRNWAKPLGEFMDTVISRGVHSDNR